MTISDSTVAITGTGNIGSRVAADLAAGGQDFLLADRDQDAAQKIAADLGGHAEVVSIDEAVGRAGVLVVCLWMDAFEQLIAQYGARLAGKVIVDPSNPVGPDGAGGYHKVIGAHQSSGQILAERAVLFYAAGDDAAGDLVAGLTRAAGFDPVKVGGLDQSVRIEMFGDLHEVGALGRTVTRPEALAAI